MNTDPNHDLDSWDPRELEDPSLDELGEYWLAAKREEKEAQERRRLIEDAMLRIVRLPETFEGTRTLGNEQMKIKLTTRINRTVDSDLAQEIAAENGLTEHLSSLFRWKPEINRKAWEAADASITGPLSKAVTAKPGRPSFTIEV